MLNTTLSGKNIPESAGITRKFVQHTHFVTVHETADLINNFAPPRAIDYVCIILVFL